MDFQAIEASNGLRMSFQTYPTNKTDQENCSIPFGYLYTPLKQNPNLQVVNYQPLLCQKCRSALNPYCTLDLQNHYWSCSVCRQTNKFPDAYNSMTANNLCLEATPDCTTIEYQIQGQPTRPIFVFVVDTCSPSAKEHEYLKDVLLQTFASLPKNSIVGFITYGTVIYVHETHFSECPRSYVFNGTKTYTPQQLMDLLSVSPAQANSNPFFVPIEEAEATLTPTIDGLEIDPFSIPKGQRALRCTGAALHLAITLIESLFPTSPSSIMVLSSGPITKGPGAMASPQKSDFVRQHSGANSLSTSALSQSSIKFFTELGTEAASHSISINYLSACFEETGMYEVEPCILSTGGFVVNSESWNDQNLVQTLVKYFDGGIYALSGSDALLKAIHPPELIIDRCIGPCIVNTDQIIDGHPTTWKFSALLPTTTAAIYLQVPAAKTSPIQVGQTACIQFQTRYRHTLTGNIRLRVTTTQISFADIGMSKDIFLQQFDQQAAAVLIARFAMEMLRTKPNVEVVRYIDRLLSKACRTFGRYLKGQPDTLVLPPEIMNLPEFMYNLRRGQFLSTFNSTPDLTASLRHALCWEDVSSSMFMIQPLLKKYMIGRQEEVVPLDMNEIRGDCVLLLDTYYRVLIWSGAEVAGWRKLMQENNDENEKEKFSNVALLLETPKKLALQISQQRCPTPLLVEADEGSSKARYLLSKVSTSTMEFSDTGKDGAAAQDTSLAGFINKFKQAVVSQ